MGQEKWLDAVEKAARGIRPLYELKRPYFPDVLNQPDYVFVPKAGQLVAVYLYGGNSKRLSWRTATLPAIEDLFELKVYSGESSVAVALMDADPDTDDQAVYLRNMFDYFVSTRGHSTPDKRQVAWLSEQFTCVKAKQEHYDLWIGERERMAINFRRFDGKGYANIIEEKPRTIRTERRSRALLARMEADERIDKQVRFRSPKDRFAGLAERNRFVFDFGMKDRQGRRVAIDVVLAKRYRSRQKVRYLLAKARFMNYEPMDFGIYLTPRQDPVRLVLLVEGSLRGPDHDPLRYVRALTSVGWEVKSIDDIEDLLV